MNNLEKMALYATEHGMSYGQLQTEIAQRRVSLHDVLSVQEKTHARDPEPVIPDDGKLHIIKGKIYYRGEARTVSEWAMFLGVPENTIRERIKRGVPAEHVFSRGRLKE